MKKKKQLRGTFSSPSPEYGRARLERVLGHVHGGDDSDTPLWAILMDGTSKDQADPSLDYAWDGSVAMRGNCRCTRKKWNRLCKCLRCCEHFGQLHNFDYIPGLLPQKEAAPSSVASRRCFGGDELRAARALQPHPTAAGNEPLKTHVGSDTGERQIAGMSYLTSADGKILGPVHPGLHWRVGGLATFARLPQPRDVRAAVAGAEETAQEKPVADIAIVGVPFDSGCSFRPGARFGPESVRTNSRLIRPYLMIQQNRPFLEKQCCDAGDVIPSPFGIDEAVRQIHEGVREHLRSTARRLVVVGGDHTLSYPVIRAVAEKFGPVALVHFDAHLDTFPPQFGQDVWHGSPFRNCWEEGLLAKDHSTHVGIRASTWSRQDLLDSDNMGIQTLFAEDVHERGVEECLKLVRERATRPGEAGKKVPVYVSLDIDTLDPSVAPGTGTPEFGGLLAHQLLRFVRGLKGLPIVSCDVVEVAPAYDHAGITAMAAANLVLELMGLLTDGMDTDGFA